MKKKSLLRTTGRRKNVFELIDSVLFDYHQTRASMDTIAQINKVSPATVSKIVEENYYVYVFGGEIQVTFKWDDETKSVSARIGERMYPITHFFSPVYRSLRYNVSA